MNDMSGAAGGGFDERLGDKPLTVTSVLKEFQGLKDKFKNEDEDDCESVGRPREPSCLSRGKHMQQ